jgi:MarR family transcriptional regulator, 2-MHQ and catechol-resistance regulon repressor
LEQKYDDQIVGDKERPDELTGGSGGRRRGNEVEEAVQSEDQKDEAKKKTSDDSSDFHVSMFLLDLKYIDINIYSVNRQFSMRRKETSEMQDSTGVHVWLVLMKAFQALIPHAEESIKRTELGDSDFRVLEVLLHKGPLPVNTVGPKVWLTPGSISVAVDRLVKKGLVSRKDRAGDRRVRQVELTAKGRALITRGFREHAAAMETAVSVLSKNERLTLLRLLKKLGKHAAETRD